MSSPPEQTKNPSAQT